MADRSRPEKRLEREVLIRVGRTPELLIAPNLVGVCYRPAVLPILAAALRPFGRDALGVAMDILGRNRVTVGLGVGSPDIVGCYQGRAFGWELKAPGGRLSPEQERWHAAARGRGLRVDVVRSAEEAAAALAAIGGE